MITITISSICMFDMCMRTSCKLAGEAAYHLLERHRHSSSQALHLLEKTSHSRAFKSWSMLMKADCLPCTRLRVCSVSGKQTGLMGVDYRLKAFCLQMGQIITTVRLFQHIWYVYGLKALAHLLAKLHTSCLKSTDMAHLKPCTV